MTSLLPYVLLGSTLTVRWLIARKHPGGFYLDIASVPLWLTYYAENGSWPLLAIPLLFGWMDVMAMTCIVVGCNEPATKTLLKGKPSFCASCLTRLLSLTDRSMRALPHTQNGAEQGVLI